MPFFWMILYDIMYRTDHDFLWHKEKTRILEEMITIEDYSYDMIDIFRFILSYMVFMNLCGKFEYLKYLIYILLMKYSHMSRTQ